MARHSLAEYLDNFLRYGQEIAYVQPQGYRTVRWPYRRVVQTALQFGRELDARRITKGDRVLLWGPNSAEWVAAFLGCAMRGVVVVPIDDASLPEFALRVQQQVSAKLLVCAQNHVPDSMPALVLEDLAESLARHSAEPNSPVQIEPADALEIVFTSGTTAEPKGVVISHGNVLANIEPLESEIRRYLKYERLVHPVRFLNLLPLSHVFGQFLGIFLPQLMGGTVIFQDTMKPADIMRTIRKERISVLVTVPRVLQSLREKVERDLADAGELEAFHTRFRFAQRKHFLRRWWTFRNVRRQFGRKFWAFISGGAALDRQTEEFWDRLGYAVIQGYGLTETTSLISLNHPFRLGKGSIGKVLAGREVRLADDGEILVRGGGVATRYWDRKSQRPLADADGWYQTGDIGEFDAAGNLYFKGRKKEVIVTPAGMNIYPEDLEAALRSQPAVKDVVVVPWARGGNAEPCAAIILRDREVNAEAVVKSANQSLAEYQRINLWLTWREEDFPRTSTQKPRRDLILQTVKGELGRKHADPAPSALAEMIQRITGRSSGAFSPAASLESDLNLSSLDRVELLSTLEDRYQVDLSEARFAEASTLGDLEQMLRGNSASRARFHYPRFALRWPVTWVRLAVHYLLLRPAVFLLGWPRVTGRQNLRGQSGPFLVICNHIGDVDPGFVLTALPSRLRHRLAIATGGEALQILRTPPPSRGLMGRSYDRVKWFLGVSLLNLFPLPKEAGFRDSFAYAGECIDRGYGVLVFPEGRHTLDGKMLPFRSGIGLLANNLRVPILPMRIDGLFARKQAGKKFAWPGQIQVRIGKPVQFASHPDPQSIAEDLRKVVETL
jgi:long-chain acyl-CoA synthetase